MKWDSGEEENMSPWDVQPKTGNRRSGEGLGIWGGGRGISSLEFHEVYLLLWIRVLEAHRRATKSRNDESAFALTNTMFL